MQPNSIELWSIKFIYHANEATHDENWLSYPDTLSDVNIFAKSKLVSVYITTDATLQTWKNIKYEHANTLFYVIYCPMKKKMVASIRFDTGESSQILHANASRFAWKIQLTSTTTNPQLYMYVIVGQE